MKFGVREIVDVVFRAKAPMRIGDLKFEKNAPVFYFDSLKTSSIEGASTTVYAEGGKGNARLMSWEGEKTLTFTMEDALISPVTLSMLASAEVSNSKVQASTKTPADRMSYADLTKSTATQDKDLNFGEFRTVTGGFHFKINDDIVVEDPKNKVIVITISKTDNIFGNDDDIHHESKTGSITAVENEENVYNVTVSGLAADYDVISLGYYKNIITGGNSAAHVHVTEVIQLDNIEYKASLKYEPDITDDFPMYLIPLDDQGDINGSPIRVYNITSFTSSANKEYKFYKDEAGNNQVKEEEQTKVADDTSVERRYLADYYYTGARKVTMIDIPVSSIGHNYYIEASTLFRAKSGEDLAAEFIIPSGRIQSNFTFSLASTGDPSTFTFTVDAFPDYTKHDPTKKVLATIQMLEDSSTVEEELENSIYFRG